MTGGIGVAKPLIAVIDDVEALRVATGRLLRSLSYDTELFPSAEDFATSAHLHRTSGVIVAVELPCMNGLELQPHMAATGHDVPIVFVTGNQDEMTRNTRSPEWSGGFHPKAI